MRKQIGFGSCELLLPMDSNASWRESFFAVFLTYIFAPIEFVSINNKFNPLQGNRNDSQNENSNDDK